MKHKHNFQLSTFIQFIIIIILSAFFACKPTEIIPQNVTEMQQKSELKNFLIHEKINIIPHQTFSIEKNESGQKYLKTLPGEHIVIKYSYLQIPKDKTLMDARYTENVWLEIKGKSLKTNDYDSLYFKKNPLYVQFYGFRNAKLIPVTNAEMHIKILDNKTAQIIINIKDPNPLIRQKNITQTLKFNQQ